MQTSRKLNLDNTNVRRLQLFEKYFILFFIKSCWDLKTHHHYNQKSRIIEKRNGEKCMGERSVYFMYLRISLTAIFVQ